MEEEGRKKVVATREGRKNLKNGFFLLLIANYGK